MDIITDYAANLLDERPELDEHVDALKRMHKADGHFYDEDVTLGALKHLAALWPIKR